ncbi:hypothetical protein [Bacillus sp. OK048]|uniref:hypothetical protein n=1 Tax=Bacillus sp. OK048 TaxID=1882761 RepID=UPI000884E1A4|nr:hypothetical protein [Bacillus sp. OK048]SDN63125.1 hypothetical protein SAMN05443253_11552 [Bacillus sp. OK048]
MKVKNMSAGFKLYKKGASLGGDTSFFEMVSGKNTETKQTKSLAYILTHCPEFRQQLFSLPQIKGKIGKYIKDCDYIRIDGEMLSIDGKYRRDITITFYRSDQPQLTIVIEAKGLDVTAKGKTIEKQLSKYLTKKTFQTLQVSPKS